MSLPISTLVRKRVPSASTLLDTAVKQTLLKLEVRDAVTHQTTDGVVLLVDDDGVAGAGELLCGGEAGRARADAATVWSVRRCGGSGLT